MSPCSTTLVGDAKRVHPFPENSMGAVLESAERLNNPSAQWLTASLDAILSAYSNIHSLANSNSKWVNDCLDDIVKLLDMCNAVNGNISDVKYYQTLLQRAIHSMDHAGMEIGKMSQSPLARTTNMLADCRRACICNVNAKCNIITTSRLRAASSNYSRISGSELGDLLSKDMCNLKDCTASVLQTVANALSLDLPRPSLQALRDPQAIVGRCSRLRSLFERVMRKHKRSKVSRCLLHELVSADVLVRKLYDLLAEKQQKEKPAEVKDLIEELEKCRVELDNGIGAVDSKIKELYAALIRARVALLDILTYSL